jgi:hypothetical protein
VDSAGRVTVTLINKDEQAGVKAAVKLPRGTSSGEVLALSAPDLASKEARFGPAQEPRVRVSGGVLRVEVPAGSASVIQLG